MNSSKIAVLGLFGRSAFMSVSHFHQPGETLHAHGLYIEPGGKGYNQAVAAKRLGADVVFYGCGGEDADCDQCLQLLKQEGIAYFVERCSHTPTAFATILTDGEGENRVTVFPGAAARFTPAYVRENAEGLNSSSLILLNLEYPQAVNEAVLQIANDRNIPVILNPAPAKQIPQSWISRVWLFTPNRQEAAQLAGVSQDTPLPELAAALNACGITRAVVTLGAEGAMLVDGQRTLLFAAVPVTAVDTTGAGDTFNGALAAALADGASLEQAVCYAIHAAALKVQKPFVMPAIPDKDAVERFLQPIQPHLLT